MAEMKAASASTSKDGTNPGKDESKNTSSAVGIDLGTTYSCVAVQKNGRVEIIVNDQGNRITPSCVAFTHEEHLVGEGAVNQASRNPTYTIYDAKRLIGRKWNEEIVQSDMRRWPFCVIPGEDDHPVIVVEHKGEERSFAPEEISAMVLSKMKRAASSYLGRPVEKAVVTVPAYFNNAQRQATKDAGEIAGLEVIQILNEPTAAALAYGVHHRDALQGTGKKKVLIFDLGGGTLDVSLLEADEHGVFDVKATSGDTHLGGQDFDNCMVDHLAETFREKHGKDLQGNPRSMSRLKSSCEKAKRMLSSHFSAEIHIDSLFEGIDFTVTFGRAKFEELNDELFRRCLEPLSECLKVARVRRSEVDQVVLVGGSTRMPRVQELLEEFFGRPGLIDQTSQINPDEAVAYGAAIHAAQLEGAADDVLLLDVTPLSLGVDDDEGNMDTVIPRCSRIPCSFSQRRATSRDNQTRASFAIYEGESPRAAGNHLLGEFVLLGLRQARKGCIEFLVVFKIDMDGILHVSAKNTDDGKESSISIDSGKRTLDREEISRMIRKARRLEAEAEDRARVTDAMHKLQTLILEIQKSIKKSKGLFGRKKEAWNKIEGEVNKTQEWLEQNNRISYHELEYREEDLRREYKQIGGA